MSLAARLKTMNINYRQKHSLMSDAGLNAAVEAERALTLYLNKQELATLIARAKGRHFLIYNGAEQICFDAVPEIHLQSGPPDASQIKGQ
jgi:hypothetical protein